MGKSRRFYDHCRHGVGLNIGGNGVTSASQIDQKFQQSERRRGIATILVSLLSLVVSGYLVKQQTDLQGQQTQLSSQQQNLTRQVDIAERYNNLAGELASQSGIERIAGIYGLRDLADDQPSTRSRIVKILAADVHAVATPKSTDYDEIGVAVGSLRAVTAEMRFSQHTDNGVDRPLAYDLSGANIGGYPLIRLKADHGYFVRTDLTGSDLSGSTIYCTDLTQAHMHQTILNGATVQKVRVDGADLSGIVTDKQTRLKNFYWDVPPVALPMGINIQRSGTANDFRAACP